MFKQHGIQEYLDTADEFHLTISHAPVGYERAETIQTTLHYKFIYNDEGTDDVTVRRVVSQKGGDYHHYVGVAESAVIYFRETLKKPVRMFIRDMVYGKEYEVTGKPLSDSSTVSREEYEEIKSELEELQVKYNDLNDKVQDLLDEEES